MNHTNCWSRALILAGIALSFSGSTFAHDLRGVAVTQSDVLADKLAQARLVAPSDPQTRSVLNTVLLWPVPRELTICFVSGSKVLRGRVTEAMTRLWPIAELTSGRLKFDSQSFANLPDCSPNPTADIRVDFKAQNGYWSYVGVDSRRHLPSMNLQGFTDASPTGDEFDRLVGHETGHALGLEHEHQSPAAPVCGWNYSYIWSHYSWDSEADMHYNLDRLQDKVLPTEQHAYIFSLYDQTSLMHYYFEPDAFTAGMQSGCYIKAQATAPSQQDLRAIRVAYGSNLAIDQVTTKSIPQGLSTLLAKPEYTAIKELVAAKASLLP